MEYICGFQLVLAEPRPANLVLPGFTGVDRAGFSHAPGGDARSIKRGAGSNGSILVLAEPKRRTRAALAAFTFLLTMIILETGFVNVSIYLVHRRYGTGHFGGCWMASGGSAHCADGLWAHVLGAVMDWWSRYDMAWVNSERTCI